MNIAAGSASSSLVAPAQMSQDPKKWSRKTFVEMAEFRPVSSQESTPNIASIRNWNQGPKLFGITMPYTIAGTMGIYIVINQKKKMKEERNLDFFSFSNSFLSSCMTLSPMILIYITV
jgi:hypothetical protein